jgi:hypothetical protein
MEILLRIKRAKGERRGGESDERCHTSAIRKVYHSISFDSSLNSRTEILQQFRSKQLYKYRVCTTLPSGEKATDGTESEWPRASAAPLLLRRPRAAPSYRPTRTRRACRLIRRRLI